MDRPIQEYFPQVLRGVREFEELANTEDVEFDKSWVALDELQQSMFVETAGEKGLMRYERLLNIPTVGTDGVPARRFRILSKLNNQLPYSMGWLENKLTTAFGSKEEYTIERDVAEHTLSIEVDMIHAETLAGLYADLRKSIPANTILHTNVSTTVPFYQYVAFVVQTADEIYF